MPSFLGSWGALACPLPAHRHELEKPEADWRSLPWGLGAGPACALLLPPGKGTWPRFRPLPTLEGCLSPGLFPTGFGPSPLGISGRQGAAQAAVRRGPGGLGHHQVPGACGAGGPGAGLEPQAYGVVEVKVLGYRQPHATAEAPAARLQENHVLVRTGLAAGRWAAQRRGRRAQLLDRAPWAAAAAAAAAAARRRLGPPPPAPPAVQLSGRCQNRCRGNVPPQTGQPAALVPEGAHHP